MHAHQCFGQTCIHHKTNQIVLITRAGWFWCALVCAPASFAASLGFLSTAGVLQQPTSHYYHACYGFGIEAANDKKSLITRLHYMERPEFSTQIASEDGQPVRYVDKESGGFLTLGTRLSRTQKHGLFAYFGLGQMTGYIRSSDGIKRGFSLPGPTASIEYQKQFGNMFVTIGHQTFAGYVDRTQLYAFVAWPYNIFNLNIGYRW